MDFLKKTSFITLIFTCLFLSIYRINNVSKKEISWDVLGYYLYLPATFVHHDPMMNDISWLQKVNEEKQLAGTLYMVSSNDEGKPMYFFLMGTAILYSPFYFIGDYIAASNGYPTDGFSMPYQYSMVIGGILFTIIGLIYFRKILLTFFSEKLTAILILLIVFGTNYIHHLTLKNLETVNLLFMLVSIVIWFTIKWHQEQKFKHLLKIGISITLIGLIKPTEAIIILFPILWNVTSKQLLFEKVNLLKRYKKQLIYTILICLLIALPQISYWYIKTGHIIYDTYKNPGVGLDLTSPHILNILFSFRKGWLIYTPIMLFSLIGFYHLYQNRKDIFYACFIYFIASFYIISSWSEWWYGAAFSVRPLITLYPILAVSLGYFLLWIHSKSILFKFSITGSIIFFVFLNQFQWWQLKNYILDPYRTTNAYYFRTFLKTSVTEDDQKLLLIARDFTAMNEFKNQKDYKIKFSKSFLNQTIKENEEFSMIYEAPYKELTEKDHLWIKGEIETFNTPKGDSLNVPILVFTFERKEGAYGYFPPEIKTYSEEEKWVKSEFNYLTPEIRNTKDRFKIYVWNRSKKKLKIRNIRVTTFEKKE